MYIELQLHILPSAALSSQTGLAFSLARSRPSPRSRTDLCNHTAARSPSLPLLQFSTFLVHINARITTIIFYYAKH